AERTHRQADLEGVPRVRLSTPAAFFADALEEATREVPLAPTWVGELYLENHRGVLTSQHRTKWGNRHCEHLLREAELWATTATVRLGTPHPTRQLREAWRTLLLLQFHDILPGSSITWVHREAEHMYAQLEADLEGLIASSLASLTGTGTTVMLANAGPFTLDAVPSAAVRAPGGGVPTLVDQQVPGPGAAQVHAPGAASSAPAVRVEAGSVEERAGGTQGVTVVDNAILRLQVDAQGQVTSLVHLASARELVPPGQALVRLHLRRDIPTDWDAWNIDRADIDSGTLLTSATSVEVRTDEGDAVVRVVRHHGASTFTQELRLAPGSARLDITTEVEWWERHKLLKLEFPLALHTDRAESEVQFGHVTRPIHTNTSWDDARFETVALRWVRVAEGDFGVAVANDSTYGHSLRRLHGSDGPWVEVGESLLRAPTAPDPEADQGHHVLHTSLLVGASTQDAVQEGYRLNLPLRRVTGAHEVEPLVWTEKGSGVIEAVKLAEDGSGDVVVRLYEALGRRGRTVVRLGFSPTSVVAVDGAERRLQEAVRAAAVETPSSGGADTEVGAVGRTGPVGCDGPPPAQVEWDGGSDIVAVVLRPFQLATLRISPAH
ncbi:MAG: glycosyl hydrolase-related protein, partial [Propionibacterium sp.]|nr:glycosyl hydrolase-related protein [Propionibacterium sp.]